MKNKKYKNIISWILLVVLSIATWFITSVVATLVVEGFWRSKVLMISDLNKSMAYLELNLNRGYLLFIIALIYKDRDGTFDKLIEHSMFFVGFLVIFFLPVNLYFLLDAPFQINVELDFHSRGNWQVARNMLWIFVPLYAVNILTTLFLVLRYKIQKQLPYQKLRWSLIVIGVIAILYVCAISWLPVFQDQSIVRERMMG